MGYHRVSYNRVCSLWGVGLYDPSPCAAVLKE